MRKRNVQTNGCDLQATMYSIFAYFITLHRNTGMSLNLTDDKPTLLQVMTWKSPGNTPYLSHCCPDSTSPYTVTRPQFVGWHQIKLSCPVPLHFDYSWRNSWMPVYVVILGKRTIVIAISESNMVISIATVAVVVWRGWWWRWSWRQLDLR